MTSINKPVRRQLLSLETTESICSHYGLGTPISSPAPVAGGLIHRVFRVATTEGVFVVKVLDSKIMQRNRVREEFIRSERVVAAFFAADIPAILALEAANGVLHDIEGITVMVYPWCEGKALPKSAASPQQAHQIGATLGRIHSLDLQLSSGQPTHRASPRSPINVTDWEVLVRRGSKQGSAWASHLETALPSLVLWDRNALEADQLLPPYQVISHCDLDQKNVLWRDADTPFLIDWESVGPTRPVMELIAAALDWSGQGAGQPAQDAFTAVIDGYRTVAEFSSDLALPALRCRLADWLGWLGANMHRSLDPGACSNDAALGVRETIDTLQTMYRLASGMETWVGWCRN